MKQRKKNNRELYHVTKCNNKQKYNSSTTTQTDSKDDVTSIKKINKCKKDLIRDKKLKHSKTSVDSLHIPDKNISVNNNVCKFFSKSVKANPNGRTSSKSGAILANTKKKKHQILQKFKFQLVNKDINLEIVLSKKYYSILKVFSFTAA